MRSGLFYIFFIVFMVIYGCSKDDVTPHASLLKILNTEGAYLARDVFELPDGSVIISCVGLEDRFASGQYGILPPLLAKFSIQGDLIWKIELPEIVHQLWHTIVLSNGNIVAVGLNSEKESEMVGVVLLNMDAEVIAERSFLNQAVLYFFLSENNSIDCIELRNGNIALAMPSIPGSTDPPAPRLIIYNENLDKVFERLYTEDNIVARRGMTQITIREDQQGNLILNGNATKYSNETENYFAFTLKLEAGTYEPVYNQLFTDPGYLSPSGLAVSDEGNAVWAASGPLPEDTLFNAMFNLRNQERYLIGPAISVWITDGIPDNTMKFDLSGYPKNGFISRIRKCSEGGYILIGSCNINTNQNVPSEYRILLIKLNSEYDMEWMRFPDTDAPSLGADIIETSDGFLVSATHLSLGEESLPIIFKTNKAGLIQ